MAALTAPYTLTGVLPTLPCAIPVTPIKEDAHAETIAQRFVHSLSRLSPADLAADAVWRDLFALTGTIRSFYGKKSVANAWTDLRTSRQVKEITLVTGSAKVVRLPQKGAWMEVMFTFGCVATPATACAGFLNLVPDSQGGWKIWMIRTVLEGLEGCKDVNTLQISDASAINRAGVANGETSKTNGINGDAHAANSTNARSSSEPGANFDCVVVGAGQAGLGTAGRLQALGVSYVVIETHPQVGDNWMTRYDSARLHTNREYNHLPFDRTFSPEYDEFLSKYDLAKGYQHWIKKFGIDKNIWCSTSLESGVWDEAKGLWTLCIKRDGELQMIMCQHVVLAVGGGGQIPMMPSFPHSEHFKGTIIHSAEYKSAASWQGKAGIVIGTANTAHDVAEDMVEAGLTSTTMVQRGRTFVLPVEYLHKMTLRNYNPDVPIEAADRMGFTMPYGVGRLLGAKAMHPLAAAEAERFDALERAGFRVERFGDLTWHICEKLGGHYIDVGTSAMIAKGLIKMKSNALPTHYTPTGLAFSDGTVVDADVIVFATGFAGNMRANVRDFFGDKVADRVADYWGLDEEGEIKGAFKPTGREYLRFSLSIVL